MLPASHRLSAAAEFQRAVRRGRRAGGPLVVVHLVAPNVDKTTSGQDDSRESDPDPVRVGFVVSRAVGGAVIRNRVRRRLRHLMRERVGSLPEGALVVVRAQPGSAGASYRDLGDELDRCLRRAAGS